MKKGKKLIAVLLCLVLFVSLIPIGVVASDNKDSKVVTRYSVLILDTSGSMSGTPARRQIEAAKKFCESVLKAEGTNYVAIVKLNSSASIVCEFTDDYSRLSDRIERISASGGTNMHQALQRAEELLEGVSEDAVKNIVLCSDGIPQSGSTSETGPYTSADHGNYRYGNSVYNYASELKESYYIYTLGFFHSLSGKDLEFGQRLMSDIQNAGYYEVNDTEGLDFEFGQIADHIINGKIIESEFRFAGEINKEKDTVGRCFYSDDYFLHPSTDNPYETHLRSMSLALELSTWPSKDADDVAGWTMDMAAVSPKWQNARNLLVGITDADNYPGYDADKYPGLGFDRGSLKINEVWKEKPAKDSIGLVAASKKLSNGKNLVVLAVRGGNYEREWSSNFNVGTLGEHSGFAKARDDALSFLDEYLQEKKITGNIKLWVVGYSRGGVTANMVGGKIDDGYKLNGGKTTVAFDDLYVYDFATPQGVMEKETSGNYSNIHNVVNSIDIVPKVAFSAWNFSRYGSDLLLTSGSLSKYDGQRIAKMREMLSQIDGVRESGFIYKIMESVPQRRWIVDWKKVNSFSVPQIKEQEYEVATGYALDEALRFLSNTVIGGRLNYVTDFQQLIMDLAAILMGGDLSDAAVVEFIEKFFSQLTTERLIEICSPAFSLNPLYTIQERTADIEKNVQKFVIEAFKDVDLLEYVSHIKGAQTIVIDLLGRTIGGLVGALCVNDISSIESVGNFIGLISVNAAFQPHFPEIMLAWIMSMDSYYGGVDMMKSNQSTRVIHINCPVDVTVRDGNGGKVAEIINNKPEAVEGSVIPAFINADEEKIIMLPDDENYTIEINATDKGSVNYSVDEYFYHSGTVNRLKNYYDILVESGDTLTAIVPAMTDEEAKTVLENGSSAEYRLIDPKGQDIQASEEITGSESKESYVVNVALDGEYGTVSGGGQFTRGNFALVEAFPYNGAEFQGWYDKDKLVSKDVKCRFAVKNNVTLTAKFKNTDLYRLTVKSTVGGSVENESLELSEGTQVNIVAAAKQGYRFAGWKYTGGTVESRSALSTWFTMPAENVTVTAVFEKMESSSVEKGDSVKPTDTTQKSSDTEKEEDPQNDSNTDYTAKQQRYRDVPLTGTWYSEAVEYVSERGFMSGVGDDLFLPNGTVTRAMIVQTLYAMEGKPQYKRRSSFGDVQKGKWFYDAISWAASSNIVAGYSDERFGPYDPITRQQMAAILYQYAKYKGYDTSSAGELSAFKDSGAVTAYAVKPMKWAVGHGIIAGTGKGLEPKGTATRAQIAVILKAFYEKLAG